MTKEEYNERYERLQKDILEAQDEQIRMHAEQEKDFCEIVAERIIQWENSETIHAKELDILNLQRQVEDLKEETKKEDFEEVPPNGFDYVSTDEEDNFETWINQERTKILYVPIVVSRNFDKAKEKDILQLSKDLKEATTETFIECYKCGTEQEDTQRFCVNCSTCLH
jgi:plasmid maintenance system killer protein